MEAIDILACVHINSSYQQRHIGGLGNDKRTSLFRYDVQALLYRHSDLPSPVGVMVQSKLPGDYSWVYSGQSTGESQTQEGEHHRTLTPQRPLT